MRLREEARQEFLHEVSYYEEKQAGVGKRFREAVNAAFGLIRRFPGAGAPGPVDTRRTKVKGFPFTVVYRDEPGEIVVFAVAPDSRQTGYWLPRAG
jgi:plasmid stabilization system protein ParE